MIFVQLFSPNLSSRSLFIFFPLLSPSALCFSLLTPDWKMSGGAARVSIPASVKKTIQSIKEVVEKHDDYEIYAMLKECAMDRDEAVHRLLLLGQFHEVKRKRDKKKESNKDTADTRWRTGGQGRGRGRGNFSPRYMEHARAGVVAEKSTISPKENGIDQSRNKGHLSYPSISPDSENKSSSSATLVNGPSSVIVSVKEHGASNGNKTGPIPSDLVVSTRKSDSSVSGVCASASDPVLVPSVNVCSPNKAGTIKRVVGSQRTVGMSQTAAASSHGRPSSRPSSSQSQKLSGSQKGAGTNKEWKPKSTNAIPAQVPGISGTSDVRSIPADAVTLSLPASNSMPTEETNLNVEEKLNYLKLLDRQHVIIPNHLQVPESEKYVLSFGSFDVSFEEAVGFVNGLASVRNSTPSGSDSSQEVEQCVEEPSSSIPNGSSTIEGAVDLEHQQSPKQISENLPLRDSERPNISEKAEENHSREDTALAPEVPQQSVVQITPSYSNFGLVPPVLGNQLAAFEGSEAQAHDTSRLVVQQPFDMPPSYYTHSYQPTAGTGGRFSPFVVPGAATKYGDNISVLPTQTSQPTQENGNSVVLPSSASTPPPTQATGLVQSSIPIPPQPLPVFRQPAGVHMPHYPTNYISNSQYFSPWFYLPPPTLHHFLSNGAAFPQQPPSGSLYAPGVATPATGVKYSVSQYNKPVSNVGNPTHIGVPAGYGTYSMNPGGYNTSSAPASGSSVGNDDLSASNIKDNNNGYITAQQASSFFGLAPQGQAVAFAPAQAGLGAFAGIYHPTQTVHPLLQQPQTVGGAVEMVGPPSAVYQQPQRSQINWANNY
ncbi:GBF-interacting protein 1-like isoform X2 [Ananas comosus]|uniref:GBF-interacting protein 1-like isoform X2 n=1 Tax=Ananas comosus TaxID=4615 RepID=A0A6P5GLV6_ANACO|nr:GBF-interacting protein 1-like isoform X2 [Ananas comosus]